MFKFIWFVLELCLNYFFNSIFACLLVPVPIKMHLDLLVESFSLWCTCSRVKTCGSWLTIALQQGVRSMFDTLANDDGDSCLATECVIHVLMMIMVLDTCLTTKCLIPLLMMMTWFENYLATWSVIPLLMVMIMK